MSYVEFRDVKKVYKTGEVEINALRDVDFEIEKGEFCVIVGASGAGKTTILNILGGMDTLTSGSVKLDGREISTLNKRQLTAYRRYDVGFVFQFYNLLPNMTALENVQIAGLSSLTCLQQSVMNFGILMVQGLVNSFGATVMAAFAAAVKIDTFAYLPVQDFGNAYSTFVAQNHGAGDHGRIRAGTKQAFIISTAFSVAISALVFAFARPLMLIFIDANETAVLLAGIKYLRIEGAFYFGIGCLFLLYGYFRAVQRPAMSVVLTVISLGTRVALAYILSAKIGEIGIWMAIPIGWLLADATGLITMFKSRRLQKQ